LRSVSRLKYPQISIYTFTHQTTPNQSSTSTPLHSTQLNSTPLHSTPLNSTQLNSTQLSYFNNYHNVFPSYPIRLHPQLGWSPNAPHPTRPGRSRGPNHTLPCARQIHILRPRLVAITQRLQRRGDRVMSSLRTEMDAFP
jgi:hypothetical protein